MSSLEEKTEESLFAADDFFVLMSSKEKYSNYIFQKIEMFVNNYNSLSEDENREKFFSIIHDFMIFGGTNDLNILNPLDFILKYEHLITKDRLIDVYFSLNNYECALEFIKLKKEELRECFRDYYIAPFEYESTDDYPISDFEYQFIAERCFNDKSRQKKFYSVAGCYKEMELKILLYRHFKDDVKFIFYNEEKNSIPYYGFCNNSSWEVLEEIFADLYVKGEREKISCIIKKALSYKTIFKPRLENKYPFNDFRFYGPIFLELIPRFEYMNSIDSNYVSMERQEKFIRNHVKPSSVPCTDILSNEFLANLEYLKTVPKKDLLNHPLYEKIFAMFFSFCCSVFSFKIEEYAFIFKRLFNRLIEGNSLVDMLQIKSYKSLFHYFKTNECVQFASFLNITIDDIKSYNTKQYFALRQLLVDDHEKHPFKIGMYYLVEDSCCSLTIHLLSFYGFETSKRLLYLGVDTQLLLTIAKLKYKDEEEKRDFLNIILNDAAPLIENSSSLDIIFKIFRHLREEKYFNITMKKIVKRIKSFEYALLPNVECIKDNLLLLDLVSKGEPVENKIEGIKLYNDYRLREKSSIPDIKGHYQNINYETVDMHSPEIISNGIGNYLYPDNKVGSSCLTPAGKAASCMHHGAINSHGRFFKVTIDDCIVAYSWVWRAGDVLCFDNIEITDKALKVPDYENVIMNIYLKATEEFIKISKQEEKHPIKVVICGKNKIDMLNKPFEQLEKVTDYEMANFKPNNSENLYLEDSKDTQYILYGDLTESINTEDTDYFYQYKRGPVKRFSSFSTEQLEKLINSIYFDYCLFTNKKYQPIKDRYVDGFVTDDWMVGYKDDGTYDLFYRTVNENIKASISSYLNINVDSLVKKPFVITHNYEGLDYLLDKNNYEINSSDLKDYLKSIREKFKTITQDDYYHTPKNIKTLGRIIYDRAITSSAFGQHDGGVGSNGSHFICIASISSDLFKGLSSSEGFILDQNLCAFQTEFKLHEYSASSSLKDSRYPIRTQGGIGEYQVLDYIELEKAKGILIHDYNYGNIASTLYILNEKELDLPLIILKQEEFYKVDKEELKRLIKLK